MNGSDKINKVLAEVGLKPAAFARAIGLKAAQNVYDIQKNKVDISKDVALKIVERYPKFNFGWLLTGNGEMLKENIAQEARSDYIAQSNIADQYKPNLMEGKVIPLFEADAAAGTGYGMDMAPAKQIEMIQIGGFLKESEAALRVYGNSMTPHYPPGCIVGTKQWNERFIEPGKVYVIETSENRFLKRLLYNKDKTAFRCLSDNTMKYESGPAAGEYFYPEFEIPMEDVRRIFRVVGVIKKNIM